jgi:hypothetical protein
MDGFLREATKATPLIRFEPGQAHFKIEGESYPENAYDFYQPMLAWMRQYLGSGPGRLALECLIDYMNTSSTKCLMDLFDLLETASADGWELRVRWLLAADDERGREIAEELMEDYSFPVDFGLRETRHDRF